jgi:lipopolysaccharide transport system ATP-binding protein
MSKPVIKVENLCKSYIIRHQQTAADQITLRDLLMEKAFGLFKKNYTTENSKELFWALKEISFEIQQGERVGIIGSNGAGKSTLFKILSRIVAPTKGTITIDGRVASLLEVGTGFHQELTGRENIFLNGAILGMSKTEIKSKFDQIVEFSGVEKFLDTPVKRFSSGMYIRLAFAVAAHLESEILIVDEVLAVGDAEFQKKCLGKMKDISQGGRTVLFVSHNMTSIQSLCNKVIYLQNGSVKSIGTVEDVVSSYLATSKVPGEKLSEIQSRKGNGSLVFIQGEFHGTDNHIESFGNLVFSLRFKLKSEIRIIQSKIELSIINSYGQQLTVLSTQFVPGNFDINSGKVQFAIRNLPLAPGNYSCNLYGEINGEASDMISDVLPFTIAEKDYYKSGKSLPLGQIPVLLDYAVN